MCEQDAPISAMFAGLILILVHIKVPLNSDESQHINVPLDSYESQQSIAPSSELFINIVTKKISPGA